MCDMTNSYEPKIHYDASKPVFASQIVVRLIEKLACTTGIKIVEVEQVIFLLSEICYHVHRDC